MEKKRAGLATDQEIADLAKDYPPGSWWCKLCGGANFPKIANCQGYKETFPPGHKGNKIHQKGVFVKCEGTQVTDWGGYVKKPPEVERTRQPVIDRASYERSSHWSLRQKAKEKDALGFPTKEASAAHDTIAATRRRRSQRQAEDARTRVRADPGAWECMFCQHEDGTDVFNDGTRKVCFKCGRPAPVWENELRKARTYFGMPIGSQSSGSSADAPDDDAVRHAKYSFMRWFCPNCSYQNDWDATHEGDDDGPTVERVQIHNKTVSGRHTYCPGCQYENDSISVDWRWVFR